MDYNNENESEDYLDNLSNGFKEFIQESKELNEKYKQNNAKYLNNNINFPPEEEIYSDLSNKEYDNDNQIENMNILLKNLKNKNIISNKINLNKETNDDYFDDYEYENYKEIELNYENDEADINEKENEMCLYNYDNDNEDENKEDYKYYYEDEDENKEDYKYYLNDKDKINKLKENFEIKKTSYI